MNVQDIIDEAKKAVGFCDNATLFRRLTWAIDLLANSQEGNWDGLIGAMTIAAQDGYVTLPRDVKLPMAINVDDQPTFPRSRWFEYHINGPGTQSTQNRRAFDDQGEFAYFREFAAPTGSSDTTWQIKVESEAAADDGDAFQITYLDVNDREQTWSSTLNSTTPVVSGVSVTAKQLFDFHKPTGDGWVKVYQYIDGTAANDILVGWFYPDQTVPRYRRIRINANTCIRMTYRRRTRQITSANDFIPLENPMALFQALRSVQYRIEGKTREAQELQVDAVALLDQDQATRTLYDPIGPQVMDYSSWNNESLWNDYTPNRSM